MWYIHTMEYYSFLKRGKVMVLMCPSLTRVHVCSAVSDSLPARLLCPWDSPGKNTAMGCHALLQGIFLSQGSNLCLCGFCTGRRILYHCATWGSPPPSLLTEFMCRNPNPSVMTLGGGAFGS